MSMNQYDVNDEYAEAWAHLRIERKCKKYNQKGTS